MCDAGGFALYASNYSNYSVMQSPYKHDILPDFLASCKKYSIRPCYYIGPNANGYFTQARVDEHPPQPSATAIQRACSPTARRRS